MAATRRSTRNSARRQAVKATAATSRTARVEETAEASTKATEVGIVSQVEKRSRPCRSGMSNNSRGNIDAGGRTSNNKGSPTDDDENAVFGNTVSRIINRVELEAGRETSPNNKRQRVSIDGASSTGTVNGNKRRAGGPLLHEEIKELSYLCTLCSTLVSSRIHDKKKLRRSATDEVGGAAENSNGVDEETNGCGFAAVEGDELVTLISLLIKHVARACAIKLVEDAMRILNDMESSSRKAAKVLDEWIEEDGKTKCLDLKMGLEAAAIVIFIASSEGVDQRAVSEEAIEACITLMRTHLDKNLAPALNQTGHLVGVHSDDLKLDNMSPAKKRRRSAADGTNAASKDLKKLYKLVLMNTTQHVLLVERLQNLIHVVPLDDQYLLTLTSTALRALECDCACTPLSAKELPPAHQLQLLSISLLTSAFRKYSQHRQTILDDLFPIMLRLPTGKRSLRAFGLRFDSVPTPQTLATWNANLVGPAITNGTDPYYIQMITALLLSLSQACIARPVIIQQKSEEGAEMDQPAHPFTTSGLCLEACKRVGEYFCSELLKRVHRKDGGASEYRPILSNLVEDFLLVLPLPEYPAAELFLISISNQLVRDIMPASAIQKKSNVFSPTSPAPETIFLNTAFDVLGRIGFIEARVLAAYKATGLNPTVDAGRKGNGNGKINCFCRSDDTRRYVVCCDRCGTGYHGGCVGVNRDSLPDEWHCDSCKLARIIERERLKHKSDGELEYVDEIYALQHANRSMISHREGVTELKDAARIHLVRWIQHLDKMGQEENDDGTSCKSNPPNQVVSELLELWSRPGPGSEPLSEEGTNRMILSLLSKTSGLIVSFQTLIRFFVSMLQDPNQALRKLALKAIEKTVEGDSALMQLPIISKAVARPLTDDSISVREAAVSLVGSYVVQSPVVANLFQPALLDCLKDVGVSVRKRAVKIFQDILISNPRYNGRAEVCNAMLTQAADPKEEDSVRDLIHELFVKLWLEDGDAKILPKEVQSLVEDVEINISPRGTCAGVVTPASTSSVKLCTKVFETRVEIAAEMMMEVAHISTSTDNLDKLLHSLLRGSKDSDKGKKKAERAKWEELGRKHCDKIVDALFELLVSIEEERSSRPLRGRYLAPTLQTVAVFAELAPGTVIKHISVILPYLKADNNVSQDEESKIVKATCDVIYQLSSVRGQDTSDHIGTAAVAEDLARLSYKFGSPVIESAIRAMSSLAEAQEKLGVDVFRKKLLKLGSMYYKCLFNSSSKVDSTPRKDIRSNVDRSLVVLSFICQYNGQFLRQFSFGDDLDLQMEEGSLIKLKALNWSNFALASYQIFLLYFLKPDPEMKCKAINAFSGLFVSFPRLLLILEQANVIDAMIAPETDASVQLASLKCWQKLLLSEEKRIDEGKAKAKMDLDENITTAVRISGDQDGDSTIFGGCLSGHSKRLFTMTQASSRIIRLASLTVVESLLRQGQLNPNEAVPYLMALQGDVDDDCVRELALRLLITEGEKRPDILRQRVSVGVKKAYEFQRAFYPNKAEISALVSSKGTTQCVFTAVYKECIQNNRKQRQGFFISLLKPYDTDSSKNDVGLLAFISQVLAHLPYGVPSDPLYIIYRIKSIITLQAAQLLEDFASLLHSVGLVSRDECGDENIFIEDALELASKAKFPSRTHEAKALSSKSFDIKVFAKHCQRAAALVLLFRLKGHLAKLYNLSDERIMEYDPSNKDRVGEKHFINHDATKPFDSHLFISNWKGKGNATSLDALIRQYAELRYHMREDMEATISLNNAMKQEEEEEGGGGGDNPVDENDDGLEG